MLEKKNIMFTSTVEEIAEGWRTPEGEERALQTSDTERMHVTSRLASHQG